MAENDKIIPSRSAKIIVINKKSVNGSEIGKIHLINVKVDPVDLAYLNYLIPVLAIFLILTIAAIAVCFKFAQNAGEKQEPTDAPAESAKSDMIWSDGQNQHKMAQKPDNIAIAEVDEAQESDHNYEEMPKFSEKPQEMCLAAEYNRNQENVLSEQSDRKKIKINKIYK